MPVPADCQLGTVHASQQHSHQQADEHADILARLPAAQNVYDSEGQLEGIGGCEADQSTGACCCFVKGREVVQHVHSESLQARQVVCCTIASCLMQFLTSRLL